MEQVLEKPFSEIVSVRDDIAVAECYKDLVKNNNLEVSKGKFITVLSSSNKKTSFGFISKVFNSSIDNIHRPSALGLGIEEMQNIQPQIFELLKKEIEIILLPSGVSNIMIHDFVYFATNEQILKLTEDFSEIISCVKKSQIPPEVLVDLIRQGYELRGNNYSYLVSVCKEASLYFADEADVLMNLLKKLTP